MTNMAKNRFNWGKKIGSIGAGRAGRSCGAGAGGGSGKNFASGTLALGRPTQWLLGVCSIVGRRGFPARPRHKFEENSLARVD